MTELARTTRLPVADVITNGPATIHRLLRREDAAGVLLGVTEFSPGETSTEVGLDEILYILEGELTIDGFDEAHHLRAGDCLWMPKGRQVIFRAERRCKFVYVIAKDSPDRLP